MRSLQEVTGQELDFRTYLALPGKFGTSATDQTKRFTLSYRFARVDGAPQMNKGSEAGEHGGVMRSFSARLIALAAAKHYSSGHENNIIIR
ncbi:hypothetical protein ACSV5M_08895 [Cellvibrio sp. ARAG 10.3]|uniref:hypothetical protein n=1 Tax=Cellvibrio sp. ARAG 10.3 TaxID=3451358 RepID=UPI003F463C9A